MAAAEGLSYPLIFLHDCARCLALADGEGFPLNPQGYLQPTTLARAGEVCRLASATPSERESPQLSFTLRLLWEAGLLEYRGAALHCATEAVAAWLRQAPVTQLLTLRDAWWLLLMPDRRHLPAMAFPDYLAQHWRRVIWTTCTWISQRPVDRALTVESLYAMLHRRRLTTPPGNQANLPNVQRYVAQRVRDLATFLLRVALPSLGLVRVADVADTARYYPTEEGQTWLRAALRAASPDAEQRPEPDTVRAIALHVPGDGPALTAPGYPPLRVDDHLRLRVYPGAHPALSFALLHVAELRHVPDHADPEVPVTYRITRDSLARGVVRGYTVAEVRFMLGRGSGGEVSPEALDRVRAWGREIETIACEPGYRLRLHPEQRQKLLRRRAFRQRTAPLVAQDAVWVAQTQSDDLFRYLRRRGYALTPATPTSPAIAIPVTPRAALPLNALWVLVQTYATLCRYLPGLAQLELDALQHDLEHALSEEDKAGAERLLMSQRAILAQAFGDDAASMPPITDEEGESTREALEAAINAGHVWVITYVDTHGRTTHRRIQPLRLETHDGREIVVAHCELRGAERHFRLDRIVEWQSVE